MGAFESWLTGSWKDGSERGHRPPPAPAHLSVASFHISENASKTKPLLEKRQYKRNEAIGAVEKECLLGEFVFFSFCYFPSGRAADLGDGVWALEHVSRRRRHRCSGNRNRPSGAAF